jgi:hypothetical protein
MNQEQKEHIERLYSQAIELRDRTKQDVGATMDALGELGENIAGIIHKPWFVESFQNCDWSIFKVSQKVYKAKKKGITFNANQLLLSFTEAKEDDQTATVGTTPEYTADFKRKRFYKDTGRIIAYLNERMLESSPDTWPKWERQAFTIQLRALVKPIHKLDLGIFK